jgi:hypothetical protein
MRLLLDTHTFIWFVYNAPDLPNKMRELLEDDSTELKLSILPACGRWLSRSPLANYNLERKLPT